MTFDPYFRPDRVAGYFDFSEPEYRAIAAINASTLKQPTPLQMLHELRSEYKGVKHCFEQGTALHKAVLEPKAFADLDSWAIKVTTATLGKGAEKIKEAHPEMAVVTQAILDKAAFARDAVHEHKQASRILQKPGRAEVSGLAWDEANGVWCKSRVDWLPDSGDWHLELKSTSVPVSDEYGLKREIRKRGYDIGARHYAEVHRMITGKLIPTFVFCWVNGPWAAASKPTSAPFIARLTALDREPDSTPSLLTAQPEYDRRLQAFCEAAKSNHWPAFQEEKIAIGSPF